MALTLTYHSLKWRISFSNDNIILNYPLRSPSSTNIHPNARWQQNGITVAGGNRQGNGINQLYNPWGLYVDDDQTV
ncbi:unnamed protein product, partial [Rotaria sp. Silwood2]